MLRRDETQEVETDLCLGADGVYLGEVHRLPHCLVAFAAVPNPVYHVLAAVVEHACACRDAGAEIFHSALKGLQFLRFQMFVCLVAAYGIIQLRCRRHAQRGVV